MEKEIVFTIGEYLPAFYHFKIEGITFNEKNYILHS